MSGWDYGSSWALQTLVIGGISGPQQSLMLSKGSPSNLVVLCQETILKTFSPLSRSQIWKLQHTLINSGVCQLIAEWNSNMKWKLPPSWILCLD